MNLPDRIRSFKERRIDVPVAPDGLVLDVGSGDKPSWRADVLLDGYPDEEFGGQRSGASHVRVTRPLFVADAADMPFADGVFDHVICSHVLEHVPDPAAVIAEMVRVARTGYIEVPLAASSKIIDFPSHLWWCRLDESTSPATLVFEAKTQPWFDTEIHEHLARTGLDRKIDDFLNGDHFHHHIIRVHWRGSVPYRVEGTLDPDFVKQQVHATREHGGQATLMARALTKAFVPRGHRSPEIRYDDIVKPEFRRGDDTVLENRIYEVEVDHPAGPGPA
ncbi:class I SAM-dependent methyltransferase [Nocardioides sp. Root151]|uniref:class I SAM-dependent methyltransferase n=1 Tax=Nocardioides sp. Root151 TaxID=1736475 RepID=UPI000A585E01|nr:class I SAM-dependent methyltransferase [Nocardioides sp. Root151]